MTIITLLAASVKHKVCQFQQRFYVRIFHTNVVLAAFSSYILALAKNLYEKPMHKTLMKLTEACTHAGVHTVGKFARFAMSC